MVVTRMVWGPARFPMIVSQHPQLAASSACLPPPGQSLSTRHSKL